MAHPPVVACRSIFRGRLLNAVSAWLLSDTPTHVVTATVPGAEAIQLVGPRVEIIRKVAVGRERLHHIVWGRNSVVWMTPWEGAHSIGHFWNAESGEFGGYYVNLQAPLRRSPFGFDAMDHILDIVVKPSGEWRWKDEHELAEAVEVGLFTSAEAAAIRAEGERVIATLPQLLATGWEDWQPDPAWPPTKLPASMELPALD